MMLTSRKNQENKKIIKIQARKIFKKKEYYYFVIFFLFVLIRNTSFSLAILKILFFVFDFFREKYIPIEMKSGTYFYILLRHSCSSFKRNRQSL